MEEAGQPSFQGYESECAQSNTDTYRFQSPLQKDYLSVKPYQCLQHTSGFALPTVCVTLS